MCMYKSLSSGNHTSMVQLPHLYLFLLLGWILGGQQTPEQKHNRTVRKQLSRCAMFTGLHNSTVVLQVL